MNVAIVGSNRGIGLELAKIYQKHGAHVYAFCRQSSNELNQIKPKQIIENFDVKNQSSMQTAMQEIHDVQFDQVIHVSGILKGDTLDTVDEDQLIEHYKVNSIGPILSYKVFSPFLKRGSSFSILSSRVGSIADNSSGRNFAYRMSKTAVNMAAKNLSIAAKDQGVSVLILHPGYVQTDMTHHRGDITAEQSAEGLFKVIQEKDLSDTGTFWHANGEALPW